MKQFQYALAALATLSAAMPIEGSNWEEYISSSGYPSVRFRKGMEPGSADYLQRFGNFSLDLTKRQEGIFTRAFVGESRFPYGCDTDIANSVLERVRDSCGESGFCDETSPATVSVGYPSSGEIQGRDLVVATEGTFSPGIDSVNNIIDALKALVISEAVENELISSTGPQICPQCPVETAQCNVVFSGNFFSIQVRSGSDTGDLLGFLDVTISFAEDDGEAASICATVSAAASAIIGIISPIGGGAFGTVAAACGAIGS